MPTRETAQPDQRTSGSISRTLETNARWLLTFLGKDLSQADEASLRQLEVEILIFLERQEDISRNRFPGKTLLIRWQRDLKRKLSDISKGRPWKMGAQIIRTAQLVDGRIVFRSSHRYTTNDHWPLLRKAFECLAASPCRFCSNERCGKMFLGNKRAIYCSVRCRSLVNKHKYWQRHEPHRQATIE